jgi:glucose/arabinose dehydrogenase
LTNTAVKVYCVGLALLLMFLAVAIAGPTSAENGLPPPGDPSIGKKPPMPEPTSRPMVREYRVQTWVSGLAVPWDIAFVSRSRAYITERPGRVRLVQNGRLRPAPYAIVRSVAEGEGGVMGIALHPRYPNPRYVYIMYTYRSGGALYNRVSRFTDTGSGLANERAIVSGIRGKTFHDGGALRFGPDGMLYVGTGDAGRPESAQDKSSLNGKILRATPDGKAPSDNPFPGSLVYAYGLRNVQGLAWNPTNGDLWATMHGPTGEFGLEAMDSIFIIRKGGNHGWPLSLGVTNIPGVVPPVLWFPNSSVPPALATFYNSSLMPGLRGNLFFCSLRDEALYRVVLSGSRSITRIEKWFNRSAHDGVYGRLRASVVGPDGALYVSTSNRDGRGEVRLGDDRILRISAR